MSSRNPKPTPKPDPPPGLYARPELYDLVHWDGTEAEVDLLEKLHARHGNGGKRCLEPACGTGRYLRVLFRRGWKTAGYDSNGKMLAYARRRLPGADLAAADLRTFRRPAAYDLAFCLQSTFRHLLTEADALAHLRGTAASLRPRGLYVIGMDLADYSRALDDEEVFESARRGMRARHVMFSVAPDRKRRRERIISFTSVEKNGGNETISDEYDLRSYDRGEFRRLIAASPFHLERVYDLFGVPRGLSAITGNAIVVLRL